MKTHLLSIIGFAALLVGCSDPEPAADESASAETERAAPVAAAPVETETDAPSAGASQDSALLDHMHLHAEQLDKLARALDGGDLDAAMTPAYWLSRHETFEGVPAELQHHLSSMQAAARSVEDAGDLEAARQAAGEIEAACAACHAQAGIDTPT